MSTTVEQNTAILARYATMMASLDVVQATYIWIDGCQGLRSKTKTLNFEPKKLEEVPIWAMAVDWFYSPELALGTEVRLIPVALYSDPFAGGSHKLILCECVAFEEGTPIGCNTRAAVAEALKGVANQEPEMTFTQEYYLFEGDDRRQPLGWPVGALPKAGLAYDCGVGANAVVGRDLAEAHYRVCLAAGINIVGQSAGSTLSQWKFEIGPSSAITACDDLWLARYLLHRISEQLNIVVYFDGALFPGQANASSATFSTKCMRLPGGILELKSALEALHQSHVQYIEKLAFSGYPTDVTRRLNKGNDPIAFDVKIEETPSGGGCGVLRDSRVPSNLDPYVICEQLIKTICFK